MMHSSLEKMAGLSRYTYPPRDASGSLDQVVACIYVKVERKKKWEGEGQQKPEGEVPQKLELDE